MGYSTDFSGRFSLNKPLTKKLQTYLEAFAGTRRMARNSGILQELFKGQGGLDKEYGIEGEYFVGGSGYAGQGDDASVVDHNIPPRTQPGLWCQWVPTHDGKGIEWDGNEKFYNYVEWLEYIIKNFLAPKKYVLNGVVTWQGEESEDRGQIVVDNNVVTVRRGRVVYE